ncbi:60S ribosomal protein L18a-2 [Striga hermonthica]|uniref:60S ribosomal protein L18a-2 n=1 Tax=Striga hermonthica TaxID=68872 RepID=A0A9N7NB59_STRHE|nr:60S ribosomal protein L18a-2 [Striga hermonthica]
MFPLNKIKWMCKTLQLRKIVKRRESRRRFVFTSAARRGSSTAAEELSKMVTYKRFADEHPKIYQMKLWATNEVRAKSKFWYFLRKLKKVKKSNGQVFAINEIFEKNPTTIKNCGIWLRYQSRTGYHNMYKEYRDTTFNGAVGQMYTERASRLRKGEAPNKETQDHLQGVQAQGPTCLCKKSICIFSSILARELMTANGEKDGSRNDSAAELSLS